MTSSLSASGNTRKRRPSPVSLRLTDDQRSQLLKRAGSQPLSTYIKNVLFDADAPLPRHAPRHVSADQAELAKILAWLGRTEIATHLAILAEATKSGSLVVTPPVAQQLNQACNNIAAMRTALMQAMGKQTEQPRAATQENYITPAPAKPSKPRVSAAEFKALTAANARVLQPPQPTTSNAEAALDDLIKAWRSQR